ncbi:hypothetical protein E2C01_070663 [Portunus trituberculatus]|uniref:Uncharacterized protein n=1 Tax=Portunus trituberculatus TaxID=210409 RepID=A0A5B7I2Q3_PORTR|nr:hypothetical protein [Portunus trituberculatus]
MKRKPPSTNAIRRVLYEPTTDPRMTGIAKVPANQRPARGNTLRGSLHPLIMTRADLVQGSRCCSSPPSPPPRPHSPPPARYPPRTSPPEASVGCVQLSLSSVLAPPYLHVRRPFPPVRTASRVSRPFFEPRHHHGYTQCVPLYGR